MACHHDPHPVFELASSEQIERAAAIFRALGEPSRLRLLERLIPGERCVSEIARDTREDISTISQRLKVLRSENLVTRRRAGKHIYYGLADQHVVSLVQNALAHAGELKGEAMHHHHHHEDHDHQHGQGCGHVAVKHNGHVDYLHDGCLHHPNGDKVEEHVLEVNEKNPASCTPNHACSGHEAGHKHGPGCGHEAVPHGDHICYLVDGHLHHPHGDHCDDHGPVELVKA